MTEIFLIRVAVPGDAPGIARVHVEGWRTSYSGIMPEEFLQARSLEKHCAMWEKNIAEKRDLILVAEKDGAVRGFVSGGKAREELAGYDSEVYAVYVDKELRGLGAGQALMKAFFNRQAGAGARSCALWVLEENPSRRFYEKSGGTLLDFRKHLVFGGKPLNEVAYAWKDMQV